MIFATDRLLVRKLCTKDLTGLHEMHSNPKVMEYTTGEVATWAENEAELQRLMACYERPDNDFWVWAVAHKANDQFIGTCAIIKDKNGDYEIGYRFAEAQWGKGYGKEVCQPLIDYGLKEMKLPALVAYVDKANVASVRILESTNLTFVSEYWNEACQCTDRFYKIEATRAG